ncbi:MAG: PAS domain S-box protein [Longimicrobiales bacterium]
MSAVDRNDSAGHGSALHAQARSADERRSHTNRRASNRLYQLLIENVRDYAIFALDKTGHVLSWNAGAERIKGYTAEQIIGHHFSDFYPQSDIDAGKPDGELVVAEAEGRFEDEGWRVRRDGSRFWANVVITALRDEDGELVGFGKVTRDLTGRRNAEEALRISEERFRLLVQNVKDYGIFMLDPTGHVVSWNEGAQRILGYQSEEIVGRHFSAFYPPGQHTTGRPKEELETALQEGRFEEEARRLRKDGTLFWASVVVTPVRRADGELSGFSKVVRDLTELRSALEGAIADASRAAAAEAANRAKSEFLAALSHELRTPLNAIAGYADLLLLGIHGPVNDQQIEALERINRSQQHLLGIITDLLNFSRIEAGRIHYDIAPVPVHNLIQTVRSLVEPQATAKQIAIAWPSGESNTTLRADAAKVEQIMVNLLVNAVKFTARGGRITVTYETADSVVKLHVCDTGIGIPTDKLEAIFEPFVQVGRSLSSAHEGAGLGLAISRDLARAMDGDLTVVSTVGESSTFSLCLPEYTRSAGDAGGR